jgi:hypothetical protein
MVNVATFSPIDIGQLKNMESYLTYYTEPRRT